jgi:hypothetical protein
MADSWWIIQRTVKKGSPTVWLTVGETSKEQSQKAPQLYSWPTVGESSRSPTVHRRRRGFFLQTTSPQSFPNGVLLHQADCSGYHLWTGLLRGGSRTTQTWNTILTYSKVQTQTAIHQKYCLNPESNTGLNLESSTGLNHESSTGLNHESSSALARTANFTSLNRVNPTANKMASCSQRQVYVVKWCVYCSVCWWWIIQLNTTTWPGSLFIRIYHHVLLSIHVHWRVRL